MIRSFHDKGTEDVFHGRDTKQARRTCPQELWEVARRKLDYLNKATRREDMRFPPGNRWEKLTDERKGQDAVRINDQYRICYVWTDEGVDDVEIVDYH